ncbi:MAG: universal stress protein [Isosphaeraceae bacterium]|nr:universal stress protein [Isosphaeraceae bacterium]
MLSSGERPRELRWYHAGPMLFGDWGTSRLYVLGLAFAFNGRASFWFIALMSVLLVGVGWSYEIICRLFPDGGGVYSSARHRSQLLAVVGGLLLCADYVVTASLSCLDAFHYLEAAFGFKGMSVLGMPIEAVLAASAILAIGGLNYLGPTKTGTIAMFIALATVALTLVIGVRAAMHIFHLAPVPGLGPVHLDTPDVSGWAGIKQSWIGFTEIVLALSGVEAIANMTGIMVQPVQKTARKAIVPVLVEIVLLNLILAAAMNTLPDSVLLTSDGKPAHTDDMLKVIASHYVGETFAKISSVVFGLLLLSAVNTALADLVSIQYMLSRDKELPHAFSGLNRFGMPALPLLIAAILPALVVLIFPDVTALSGLYAIGVVGAIGINLGTTSTNFELPLRRPERGLMLLLTLVMIAIEATICVVKPEARGFALIVLVAGLAARLVTIVTTRAVPIPRRARLAYLGFAATCVALELGITLLIGHSWVGFGMSVVVALAIGYASYQTQSYRAVLIAAEAPAPVAPKRPSMLQPGAYAPKSRIMVASQGNPRLIEFAIDECKSRHAELMFLFIRHLAITPMGESAGFKLDEDAQALELFDRLRVQAKEAGVPLRLLYGVARDVPDAILDMAVTHGADFLLLGTTRRGTLWRAMKGDVIQAVAEQLPESVGLLIHA